MSYKLTPLERRLFFRLLIERDSKHCHYCGEEVFLGREIPSGPKSVQERELAQHRKKKLATIDHLVPVALGGEKSDLTNMVIACCECNHQKGRRLPLEFTKTKVKEVGMDLRQLARDTWSRMSLFEREVFLNGLKEAVSVSVEWYNQPLAELVEGDFESLCPDMRARLIMSATSAGFSVERYRACHKVLLDNIRKEKRKEAAGK